MFQERPITGTSDIEAIKAFVRAMPAEGVPLIDLPYRLSSWALDEPKDGRLWLDASGELLGWALLQWPFATLDYQLRPETTHLLPRVIEWADERARGYSHPLRELLVYIPVAPTDMARGPALEAMGFERDLDDGEEPWTLLILLRDEAERPEAVTPPPSFEIRPLAGAEEVEKYVECHRTTFGTKTMTAEWRARTLEQPEYERDLDLVAVTPEGQMAALCVGWLGRDGGDVVGQIEPLGVHPEFQRLGLGRAILHEALRRFAQKGARKVYVATNVNNEAAISLYRAARFREHHEVWMLRRGTDHWWDFG